MVCAAACIRAFMYERKCWACIPYMPERFLLIYSAGLAVLITHRHGCHDWGLYDSIDPWGHACVVGKGKHVGGFLICFSAVVSDDVCCFFRCCGKSPASSCLLLSSASSSSDSLLVSLLRLFQFTFSAFLIQCYLLFTGVTVISYGRCEYS